MLKVALSDFAQGLADFFRGLFTVHKLRRSFAAHSSSRPPPSASNDSPNAQRRPLTTLEQRRQVRARAEQRTAEVGASASPPPRVVPSAVYRIGQCIVVNCVLICCFRLATYSLSQLYAMSVHSCDYGALPLVLHHSAAALSALWLVPLFTITRLVNCLWFQDIANAAAAYSGKQTAGQASFSRNVADLLLAVVLEAAFLLQSHAVALLPVPVVAHLAAYMHLALLYALYSFEYSWITDGVDLSSRLRRIEQHWCYYAGFGLPLTLLTIWPESVALSGCFFGMAFPFALLSSYQARPPPSSTVPPGDRPPPLHIFHVCSRLCHKLALAISHCAQRRIVAHSKLAARHDR